MLDDLKYIHQKDAADILGIVAKLSEQLRATFKLEGQLKSDHIYNIVYAGMGGSAFAAQLLETWPALPEPFQIVRDYDLPAYVDGDTLVVCASYSGNSEETLSALKQAEQKGAQIAAITAGGQLEAIAKQRGYLLAKLPQLPQPRYGGLYNFTALLQILTQLGIIKKADWAKPVAAAADLIDRSVKAWLPTVPAAKNPAKQLAQELMGQSVVVYSGPKMFPAAYKWKININENAKQVAWCNQLPEFSHNEFVGWSEQPVDKPYVVVELRSPLEHHRIRKRFKATEKLLSGRRPSPLVVTPEGQTAPEQLLWLIAYGDFVSLYLSLLNGLNPAPVDLVDKFKKEMDK